MNLDAISKPYVDIKHLSAIPDEEEILFMISCVFRINQIYYNENIKLWMAKLTLCSQNDREILLFKYLNLMKLNNISKKY